MKIFMIAGEVSGDVLGGRLMNALKKQAPQIEITGIGGAHMATQGLQSLIRMEDLCVMGLSEVVKHLPRLYRLIYQVVRAVERANPDLLLTIDLPDFNFQVARILKKRGRVKTKIIHYVAPSVWAWRPGRAKKISKFLDGLICLFPFEPPYFTVHGLNAICAGHPLVENISLADRDARAAAFRQRHGIPADAKLLAVLFGSRQREWEATGPDFIETLKRLAVLYPDFHVAVPTLPGLESQIAAALDGLNVRTHILLDQNEKWDCFLAADAALAVSGTVGLELAYTGTPHVIGYKMSAVSWAMLRRLSKTPYAHLANIMAGRMIVPEFLQDGCTAQNLAPALQMLLNNPDAQRQDLRDIGKNLGAEALQAPSEKAANFIFALNIFPRPSNCHPECSPAGA